MATSKLRIEKILPRLCEKGPITKIESFVKLFSKIKNAEPEDTKKCASILLKIMKIYSDEKSNAAEQFLGWLNIEAFEIVVTALKENDLIWRNRINSIIWRLIGKSTENYIEAKGEFIIKNLLPYLDDTNMYKLPQDDDLNETPDYQELRICDEIYLLILELLDNHLEGILFIESNYEIRDELISFFKDSSHNMESFPLV